MAYVAVSGGKEAIEESIRLLDYYRSGTDKDIETEAIENKLSLLVDRVMSEAGLYSRAYAALALKQCEGGVEEAVFLLRDYRSTLPRVYYTNVVNTSDMRVVRRISAAFKDIAGGQILGATYDYTHRLINFDLDKENPAELRKTMLDTLRSHVPVEVAACPRVSEELKNEGLIDRFSEDDRPPHDVTTNMLEFPVDRSARLQTLSRADTGFISGIAYSALRGFGQVHPTVGELRCGYVELTIPYPYPHHDHDPDPTPDPAPGSDPDPTPDPDLTPNLGSGSDPDPAPGLDPDPTPDPAIDPGSAPSSDPDPAPDSEPDPYPYSEDDCIYIGEILITEVECFNHADDKGQLKLAVGYGAVFGRNENKAISMAVIDHELNCAGPYPAQDEEFVLTHGDSLEMNGFISHLKLPHYVTFQSKLDAVRKTRRAGDE